MSTITHQKVSIVADGANADQVQPSNWNQSHIFTPPLTGVISDELGTNNFTGIAAATANQYLRSKRNVPSTSYEFVSPAAIISTDYTFSQAIPQNLTAGISAGVVCNPLPLGINSNSSNKHYIRIIDAVAGNEIVLITFVSGSTVALTPTLSHASGDWTIESASNGIQEAIHAAAAGGTVIIPPGSHTAYKKIFSNRQIMIQGHGMRETTIIASDTANNVFEFVNSSGLAYASIKQLGIFPVSGSFSAGACIYCENIVIGNFEDLLIQLPYIGLKVVANNTGGGNPTLTNNIFMYGVSFIGIHHTSTGTGQTAGIISNIYSDGAGSTTLEIDGTSAGYDISNIWSQQTAYGILLSAATRNVNEVNIVNCILDGPTVAGLYFIGQGIGTGTNGIDLSNILVQHDAASYGMILQAGTKVKVGSCRFNSNSSNPSLVIDTCSHIEIDSSRFHANSSCTAARLLHVSGASSYVKLHGLSLFADVAVSYGIHIANAAHTNCIVEGCTGAGFTVPFFNESTSSVTIRNNTWRVAPVVVPSGGTITIPANINFGDLFIVSGVTTVTRILGGQVGAHYRIATSSVVSVNSGGVNPGNIATNNTTRAGGLYTIAFDSTSGSWYFE